MKLSILIVNWNTRDLVVKAIHSILRNAPPFDYEVVVVDNNSPDGSADTLINLFGHNKKIRILELARNVGFAAANNLAFSYATGDYILLLNPDTEVLDGALEKLVEFMEKNPAVGVAGPRLINPDGSFQPSVRRFPDIWSSVLILSGLYRFWRPKRYLMDDFDYNQIGPVDQVMGAALLTRRKIIEQLGFLDENFWLWYEEVDFCKRVKDADWQVMHYPEAVIMHHGAQSFAQIAVYSRKKTLARSLIHYFSKHGNVLHRLFIKLLMPVIVFAAYLLKAFKHIGVGVNPAGFRLPVNGESSRADCGVFCWTFLAGAVLEVLSLLSFRYEALSPWFIAGIGLLTFWIARRSLRFGVYVLFAELFIGSRGHLLEYRFLSLRTVVFAAVFLAWGAGLIKSEKLKVKSWTSLPLTYWFTIAVIVLASLWGFLNGNGLRNVFLDANGYLYLLILPAVLTAFKNKNEVAKIFDVLAAAIVLIGLKGLTLFLWFTYSWPGIALLYRWVLGHEIGEITALAGGTPRIFMQSQFYALMGLFVFALAQKMRWLVLSAAVFSLILSLSRSFWLGALFGALFVAIVWLWRLRASFRRIFRIALILSLIIVLELGVLYLLVAFNPSSNLDRALGSRVGNPVGEAAGGARLLLLPKLLEGILEAPILGQGFGREISYESFLPDFATPENPTARLTSFAFEWGYLDMWLKMGLLGLLVYILFIAKIFKLGWEKLGSDEDGLRNFGLLAGVSALLVLNVTTPFLNHPLGIGYLLLAFMSFLRNE